MTNILWNAVGHIGDDLIADAEAENVKRHFGRKRNVNLVKIISLAACFCLVIGLFLPYFDAGRFVGISVSSESRTPLGASSAKTPFDGVVACRIQTEKSVYKPDETPILKLSYQLAKPLPIEGTVKLVLDTGAFSLSVPSEHVLKDIGEGIFEMEIPLQTEGIESGYGTITIDFLLYPDNPEAPIFEAYPLHEGARRIGTISLSYVVNEFEFVLDDSLKGATDLFIERLIRLYETHKIDKQEFANRYYEDAYKNHVFIAVHRTRSDGAYVFGYRSQHIRYDSPFLSDPEIQTAIDAEELSEAAQLALLYMYENHVITEDEYRRELALLEEAFIEHAHGMAFSGNIEKYRRLLQEYLLTH